MRTHKLSRAIRILILIVLFSGMQFQPARSAETATYSVNSLADTNDGVCNTTHCTLREAITAANSTIADDTIQFSLSGTILLGSTLPSIVTGGHALTIDATGRDIEISGQDFYRVFYVGSGATLTLRNLIIRDGDNSEITYGGGIYNDGTLNVEDCTFTENGARIQGGAIYNHQGTLTIDNTRFDGNMADESDGGALYIYKGHVSITNSAFNSNTAAFSGGAIYNRYEGEHLGGELTILGSSFYSNRTSSGSGGAIANDSDLVIEDSTFLMNTAAQNGGAVYDDTGGVFKIERSTFGLNSSNFGNGGGIYIDNPSQAASIYDSIFSLNSADNDGGGFYVYQGTTVFSRTRFFGNLAGRGGGGFNLDGVVYLLDSSFESNSASEDGGGFYNDQNMIVERSTFSGNDANLQGGGLYHALGATNVGIENSTFYQNRAEQGGGLYIVASITIRNCTISANTAETADEGGGIRVGAGTTLKNNILANNTGGNCNSAGVVPGDGGNNIDSGITCRFGVTKGSMSSTDPLLGMMMENGGTTKNLMPATGSPAIDGVIYNAPNDCPEEDQRGYPRPYGARCDIGAVERYYRVFAPLIVTD